MPSVRIVAMIALVLVLVLAAPAAHAGGPDQMYVGLSTTYSADRSKAPQTRIDFLVLFPDGLALRDMPPGGFDYDNIERYAQKNEKKVGRYTRTDSELTIEWGRSSRKRQVWKLSADGGNWSLNNNTLFQPAARVNVDQIKGIWHKGSGGGSNMVGLSGGGEFIFRSNGDYERGSGDSKRGRYELDGYTLVLHARDGSVTRYAIYRWPWAPGAIGIGESVYQVLQTRRTTRP